MSQEANLLIDFDNLSVNDSESENEQKTTNSNLMAINDCLSEETTQPKAFICSTVPIYKLLNAGASDDGESNNPFDQMDKQAALLDDPFEILENAASNSSDHQTENIVETGTLISIESPLIARADSEPQSRISFDVIENEKVQKPNNNESVQNTSHTSSSGVRNSTPSKKSARTKSNSMNLLKFTLSNSRSEMTGSSICSDDNVSPELSKRSLSLKSSRRNSATDDSFDDIWSTKPNLIDSQTDMDFDSDIDSDLANLNIPMLKMADSAKSDECLTTKEQEPEAEADSVETKANHRSELIEKLASIKLKIPQSPIPNLNHTKCIAVHNQTVERLTADQQHVDSDSDPITPKSHFSSMPQMPADNTNSLIENLKKLVDQCDDKSKQSTAKTLLDNLSSIMTTNQESKTEEKNKSADHYTPQPIKREGTFNIDKDETEEVKDAKKSVEITKSAETSKENVIEAKEMVDMNPGFTEMMKQIQSVLGTQQNINFIQTNVQQMAQPVTEASTVPTGNPTYIVVMANPTIDALHLDDLPSSNPHSFRARSQSLNLKEKPMSAIRAAQKKAEQHQQQQLMQPPIQTTPIRRPSVMRRSSFSATTRPNIIKTSESEKAKVTNVLNDKKIDSASTIKRRTSFQMPEPAPVASVQQRNAQLARRRSFQESPSSLRSPSPKSNIQNRVGSTSNRLSGANLMRRKSLVCDLGGKESPQKIKSLHGIMKKPAPPTQRNLKIRVTQTMAGRSTVPMRATVPINRVAPLLMSSEAVSPIEDARNSSVITSTPRSNVSSAAGGLSLKKVASTVSIITAESSISKRGAESSFSSISRPSGIAQRPSTTQRRRTLSDYRANAETSEEAPKALTAANLKKAAATLTTGLNKRLSNIGVRRSTGATSKENKHPM